MSNEKLSDSLCDLIFTANKQRVYNSKSHSERYYWRCVSRVARESLAKLENN